MNKERERKEIERAIESVEAVTDMEDVRCFIEDISISLYHYSEENENLIEQLEELIDDIDDEKEDNAEDVKKIFYNIIEGVKW